MSQKPIFAHVGGPPREVKKARGTFGYSNTLSIYTPPKIPISSCWKVTSFHSSLAGQESTIKAVLSSQKSEFSPSSPSHLLKVLLLVHRALLDAICTVKKLGLPFFSVCHIHNHNCLRQPFKSAILHWDECCTTKTEVPAFTYFYLYTAEPNLVTSGASTKLYRTH